jgi:hypothetical protein
MKLYREVKASERLPEEYGDYHVIDGNLPDTNYFELEWSEKYWRKRQLIWLEPIEITEEEKEEIATQYVMREGHIYRGKRMKAADIFLAGFNAALSKLKGDE